MKTLNLVQGSPEWTAHRRVHKNASDAPAMFGCSPYKTRTQLIAEFATGITPEVDERTQRLFDDGHRTEALARPLAEQIIGEDLYPVVGSEGDLSASFDGLTMAEDTGFEHKALNDTLRACMTPGCVGDALPLVYQVQMEQQCMVAGCTRILFMASKWNGDTLVEERHCWYTSNAELAAAIRAGWAQFDADVAAFKPEAAVVTPVAAAIEALPALVINVEGRVVASNLDAFKKAADVFLARIKTDLKDDQDFADAKSMVKFCKDGEDRLELVKSQVLGQTASIEVLFSTIDHISAQMRDKRLALDKLVTAREASIRTEIVLDAQRTLTEHVTALTARLGHPWMPTIQGGFAEAIKGKRTVASCKEAVSVALSKAKIDASAIADRLEANRKTLVQEDGTDWLFLFADFAHVGNAPAETFSAVSAQRIQKHRDDEQARKDALAAKASQAGVVGQPVSAVQPSNGSAAAGGGSTGYRVPASVRSAVLRPAVDNRPPITTGALCDFLKFIVTAEFVKGLGIVPAAMPATAKGRSGTYWNVRDIPTIKVALQQHLAGLPDSPAAVTEQDAVAA
jgi:predicted phage-related endonuclease